MIPSVSIRIVDLLQKALDRDYEGLECTDRWPGRDCYYEDTTATIWVTASPRGRRVGLSVGDLIEIHDISTAYVSGDHVKIMFNTGYITFRLEGSG